MDSNEPKTTLDLTEGGLWRIRSSSHTVCYLDLDRRLLLRDRGPGSPALPHDGEWVALVQVRSPRGDATIRIGDRHEFLTDPDGTLADYRWWIPRACTAIEPITEQNNPRNAPTEQ